MNSETLTLRLFEALIDGDRRSARSLVQSQFDAGASAETVYVDLFWPTYEMIERLHRSDQLSTLHHNVGTRLLRVLVDQASRDFLDTAGVGAGRTVLALCGPSEQSELGAQMAVDLLESHRFEVCFAGGGVANDEILGRIHETQPDVLLWFSSEPSDLPGVREMIDRLHEIGACPEIQIAVGGGVFARAEGLAEEIGADLWADHPLELVDTLITDATHRAPADQRTVGRSRTKRYRAAA
jgi:methanogenic corrinoid protein MtbC1